MRVVRRLALVLTGLSLAAAGAAQASVAGGGLATYTNTQYGFTLQYPAGLTPQAIDGAWSAGAELGAGDQSGTAVVAIVVFSVDHGGVSTGQPYPLFFTAETRVGVSDNTAACFSTDGADPNPGTIVLGGVMFAAISFGDAGMMKYTNVVSYRVIHGGRCYAVEQYENGSSYRDEDMTAGISDDQLQAYYDLAGTIARSFRFTDGLPSQGPPPASPPTPPAQVSLNLPPATPAQLTFARGSTRIVADGVVSATAVPGYQVGAAAGQPLIVSLQSVSHLETLSITGVADGASLLEAGHGAKWQGMLKATEDYLIQVHGGPADEPFTLTISAAAPVRFSPGGVSAQLGGSTPGGLPVDYVVKARAGQVLLLNLVSPGMADGLQVRGLEDGRILQDTSPAWLHELSLSLPVTESYLVSVVPQPGSAAAYTLDLMLPAVTLPATPTFLVFPGLGRAFVAKEVWVAGNQTTKQIYTTVDDGRTWRVAVSPQAPAGPKAVVDLPLPGFIREIHFLALDEAYICVNNGGGSVPVLLKTVDGGARWASLKLPEPPGVDKAAIRDIDTLFLSFPEGDQRGTVLIDVNFSAGGDRRLRYTTVDGGETWVPAAP